VLPPVNYRLRDFITLLSNSDDIEFTFFRGPEGGVVVPLIPVIPYGPAILKVNNSLLSIPSFNINIGIPDAPAYYSEITVRCRSALPELAGNLTPGIIGNPIGIL
jgi:hypothetical protein